MRRLFGCLGLSLLAGCGGSMQKGDVSPQKTDYVIFEIDNRNNHANYARVYITDRNCNFRGAARYIAEVASGQRRSFFVPTDTFNPNGFAVYVKLTEGISGLNVIPHGCTGMQVSPRTGDRVVLLIPANLAHLMEPGVFPSNR